MIAAFLRAFCWPFPPVARTCRWQLLMGITAPFFNFFFLPHDIVTRFLVRGRYVAVFVFSSLSGMNGCAQLLSVRGFFGARCCNAWAASRAKLGVVCSCKQWFLGQNSEFVHFKNAPFEVCFSRDVGALVRPLTNCVHRNRRPTPPCLCCISQSGSLEMNMKWTKLRILPLVSCAWIASVQRSDECCQHYTLASRERWSSTWM